MQEKQISRGQIRRITKNTGAEEIAEIVNEVKDGDVIEFEKAVYTRRVLYGGYPAPRHEGADAFGG